jgi:hypothetical protein
VSIAMQIFVLFFLVLDLWSVFYCILPVYLGCALAPIARLLNFLYLSKIEISISQLSKAFSL